MTNSLTSLKFGATVLEGNQVIGQSNVQSLRDCPSDIASIVHLYHYRFRTQNGTNAATPIVADLLIGLNTGR